MHKEQPRLLLSMQRKLERIRQRILTKQSEMDELKEREVKQMRLLRPELVSFLRDAYVGEIFEILEEDKELLYVQECSLDGRVLCIFKPLTKEGCKHTWEMPQDNSVKLLEEALKEKGEDNG